MDLVPLGGGEGVDGDMADDVNGGHLRPATGD